MLLKNKKDGNTDKNKKNAGISGKYLFFGITAALLAASSITFSMVYGTERGSLLLEASDFYFSSDVLIREDNKDNPTIMYSDTINFNLYNYEKSNTERFAGGNIEYVITAEGEKAAFGIDIESGVLQGGRGSVAAPSVAVSNYEDGETIIISAEARRPYKRKLSRVYRMRMSPAGDMYRIIDQPGSAYAELIIMTNNRCSPSITWNTGELTIDSTNPYVYSAGGTAFPNNYETGENMTLSQVIEPGASISILFFKADPNIDYSEKDIDISGTIKMPRFM